MYGVLFMQGNDGLFVGDIQGWYFTFFSSLSLITPYLNLYFRRQGYGEDMIGFLAGLRPWMSAFFGPLWAAFADKTRTHRYVEFSEEILANGYASTPGKKPFELRSIHHPTNICWQKLLLLWCS